MTVTTVLVHLSSYLIIVPFIFALMYWVKLKFKFDNKINLLGIYLIIAVITQAVVLYLAMNGEHNVQVVRIFILIETFLLSYFLLSFRFNSQLLKLSLPSILTIIIFLVDFTWGDKNTVPFESIMVESFFIIVLSITTIPSIKLDKPYENAFYYFVFGIMIFFANNLIGFAFAELSPSLPLIIHSTVNIAQYIIFSLGFYIVLKSPKQVN